MNFLAHLFLADPPPGFIIGSVAADFLDGVWQTGDPELLAGIARHQAVDRFTDAHPLHWRSRERIDRRLRHARSVVVDIIYDHFLAVHWRLFSGEELDVFAVRMHAVLLAHAHRAPPIMQAVLPRFLAENWLLSYQTVDGIHATMVRLNRRVKGRLDFLPAMDDFKRHRYALEEEFLAFFPQLQAAVGAAGT